MTGVSAVGAFSALVIGADRHLDDAGRRLVHPRRHDDDRRLRDVSDVHGADHGADRPAREHRHADDRGVRRPRSDSRNPADGDRRRRRREPAGDARGPRRGDVRRRDVRVQRGHAGAEGRVVPRARGLDDGARRIERLGQEHADQPGDDVQPPEDRTGARRRARSDAASACATIAVISASCCRTTSSSTARSPRTSPTRSRTRRATRSWRVSRIAHCDEFIQEFEKGYDTDRRRARRPAVGRPAAARRDRARDSGRPADPDPRRGDVEPRQRERGADPGRPASRCAAAARRS